MKRLEAKGFSIVTFEASNELFPFCLYSDFLRPVSHYPKKSHMTILIILSDPLLLKAKPAHANRVRRLMEQLWKTEALVDYWQRKVLKVTESVALRLPLTAFTTAVTFTSSG